jgi:hypothetical protein
LHQHFLSRFAARTDLPDACRAAVRVAAIVRVKSRGGVELRGVVVVGLR